MKLVSIVVPVYNEEEMVPLFIEKAEKIFIDNEKYNFEILFVNDGSKDKTLNLLVEAKAKYENISYVSFSRNFGHESAVEAGIRNAHGDLVVPIDCDFQDPPEVIFEMLKKYEEGYEIVNAKRSSRKEDSFLKKTTSEAFYHVIDGLTTKYKVPSEVSYFRLMTRRVIDVINSLPENKRFLRSEIPFVGFKTAVVYFERPKRAAGKTKYNYSTMFNMAEDIITTSSVKPLNWPLKFGLITLPINGAFFIAMLVMFILSAQLAKTNGNFHFYSVLFIISCLLLLLTIVSFLIAIPCIYLKNIDNNTSRRPNYIIEISEKASKLK